MNTNLEISARIRLVCSIQGPLSLIYVGIFSSASSNRNEDILQSHRLDVCKLIDSWGTRMISWAAESGVFVWNGVVYIILCLSSVLQGTLVSLDAVAMPTPSELFRS